jgi:acetyltransferase-like isoleucine patch superfamily enzyme
LKLKGRPEIRIEGQFEIGEDVSFGPNFVLNIEKDGFVEIASKAYIGRSVELATAQRLKIGFGTSIQDHAIILGDVSIGRECLFAPSVYISSGQHNFSSYPAMNIRDQDTLINDRKGTETPSKPVVIGDDCWIGIRTVIMAGITIGRGCIVGANSVVTESLPPYTVAAGAPARILRKRLEFCPPTSIYAKEVSDRAYFYEGVGTSNSERCFFGTNIGYPTDSVFSLMLRLEKDSTMVELEIRSLASDQLKLEFNSQEKIVGKVFQKVRFNLPVIEFDNFTNQLLKFNILNSEKHGIAELAMARII